jgi:CheY-like chemotaxis protein
MIDHETFTRLAREIFARLDNRPYLREHPLSGILAGPSQAPSPEVIRGLFLSAIDELKPAGNNTPGSANWRRWRCLVLSYVDGMTTKEIARQLQISDRQALRDHLAGVDAAIDVLWSNYHTRDANGRQPVKESLRRDQSPIEDGTAALDALESELARFASLPFAEPTSVDETLTSVLTTVQTLASADFARCEVSFPSGLQPVAVSSAMLRQILLCFVIATLGDHPGARIVISGSNDGDYVRIDLAIHLVDGISSRRTASAGGMVALADAGRRLAEAQGGVVSVELGGSASQRVILKLPLARFATVLVVDDNPDIGHLFRRFLTGSPVRLVQARTPRQAIKLAHELHPDVITLDVLMPSRDGWQILQDFRNDPVTRDIPVIVCSILPEKPLASYLGAVDFLAKPVTPQSLLAALNRYLSPINLAMRSDFPASSPSTRQPSIRSPG